jgi:formylglycine-generating enzyme required for sulfatase activity
MHTVNVGSFRPNAWGLYDMHGNVKEWCSDWHEPYPKGRQIDPKGPESGEYHVLRGGSWRNESEYCRSAYRGFYVPGYRDGGTYGFRVVMD